MQTRTFLLATLSLFAPVAAQAPAHDLVTNGTFTGTLTPWVMGGAFSVNPGLESGIDVTGMGVSDSFGVNAGGQVIPPPYPPNTLSQMVTVANGVTYELRLDAIGYRNSTTNNADIGTIWVEVNGVEVARHAFGSYTSPQVKRAQLCGRYTANTSGAVSLTIFFQRAFLAGAANPRMNIDNVSLIDITGPTFCMRGNRQLGSTVELRVEGEANAAYAVFIALAQLPAGVPVPGFNGLLQLDPGTLTLLISGGLDGSGVASTQFPIPANQQLRTVPIFYQPLSIGSTNELGLHTGMVMSQ
jgi:hypothetical protein